MTKLNRKSHLEGEAKVAGGADERLVVGGGGRELDLPCQLFGLLVVLVSGGWGGMFGGGGGGRGWGAGAFIINNAYPSPPASRG